MADNFFKKRKINSECTIFSRGVENDERQYFFDDSKLDTNKNRFN